MTRTYEELFIVRPDITDEELDPFIESLRTVITSSQGNLEKVEKWGVRKLAYRVQKRDEGYYVLLAFTSDPNSVRELERRLRVSDFVMKFITVRQDEKMKRAAKLKKKKDARAARKPPAPAPPPAAPLFAEPSAEAAVRPGLPQTPQPAAPAPAAGPAPAAPAPTTPEPAATATATENQE